MARTRITKWEWHVRTGYREHMRQAGVLAHLTAMAENIAAAAGGSDDGFLVESEARSGRRGTPRAVVFTGTYEAQRAEAKDRRLTRALDAAHG